MYALPAAASFFFPVTFGLPLALAVPTFGFAAIGNYIEGLELGLG